MSFQVTGHVYEAERRMGFFFRRPIAEIFLKFYFIDKASCSFAIVRLICLP